MRFVLAFTCAAAPFRNADAARPGQTAADADLAALELAIKDLSASGPAGYPDGSTFLARLSRLKTQPEPERLDEFLALKEEALLANPLLDFDELLVINRSARNLALPKNWQSHSSLRRTGHDNQIMTLSPVSPRGELRTLYRPAKSRCIIDMDLHFDGRRILFSMPGANGRWQLHEMRIGGEGGGEPRELPTIEEPDVDNYDACYLPDGGIVFSSTAPMTGVPCVRGSSHITNLYRVEPDGKVGQLTVDQEHNWCPTVTPDGRVMYLRWEYTDTPHAFYRLMFTMNPDGTRQMAMYGTNSYWPNAMFFSRPIPGSESKFVSVVGGHHDQPRMGQLILFDTSQGRREAEGVLQRIPGRGQRVEPVILDGLTGGKFPRFLHPFPLSEKYFLASCRPEKSAPWGIYLVDVFDNFLLLCEQPGRAMMEPVPVRKSPPPPVIPSQVIPGEQEATVVLSDVYMGEGLRGVSRGTIKALRVFSYNFSFRGMGGQIDRVGLDGPWDVRVILGTVPVEEDGSAHFKVPAMMPIALQPLDDEGKAVQYMRSWITARPGEVVACVGCHEDADTTVPVRPYRAARRQPDRIQPWYGPARGFSFRREVQPVLDRFCIGCHNGKTRHEGRAIADLTSRPDVNMQAGKKTYNQFAHFPPSYFELKRFVRGSTIESDAHLLTPWDFHADSTQLIQMLRKGHHGVELDAEAWDRLITWIDLNTPAHGTWREVAGARVEPFHSRRKELKLRYTGIGYDPEDAVPARPAPEVEPVVPREPVRPQAITWEGFPPEEARWRQRESLPSRAGKPEQEVRLAEGVTLRMMRIPGGRFVMGDTSGYPDEFPHARVRIDRPFWMGVTEITNRQYACFDPSHDSRLEHGEFLQFSVRERGYPLNAPDQPVLRVSGREAMAFCKWLSAKTGRRFSLPTECQWEWAARAGSGAPLWYGAPGDDFSKVANLADATYQSRDTFGWGLPSGAIPAWRPAAVQVNDGYRVSAPAGSFEPNAFGLRDMAGNVAEWTCSPWRPRPGAVAGEEDAATTRWVVRGGSWRSRPRDARSASRLAYRPEQKVIDVGFRVVCLD